MGANPQAGRLQPFHVPRRLLQDLLPQRSDLRPCRSATWAAPTSPRPAPTVLVTPVVQLRPRVGGHRAPDRPRGAGWLRSPISQVSAPGCSDRDRSWSGNRRSAPIVPARSRIGAPIAGNGNRRCLRQRPYAARSGRRGHPGVTRYRAGQSGSRCNGGNGWPRLRRSAAVTLELPR